MFKPFINIVLRVFHNYKLLVGNVKRMMFNSVNLLTFYLISFIDHDQLSGSGSLHSTLYIIYLGVVNRTNKWNSDQIFNEFGQNLLDLKMNQLNDNLRI